VFDRIESVDGDVRGLFRAQAARDYAAAMGREVKVERPTRPPGEPAPAAGPPTAA